jgi:hypothetical protein
MEGGLLIHAAWALSFTFVWVYRRWFEKTGPRSTEFEAFCAPRPLVAALLVRPGTESSTLAALNRLLPRAETLATHGAWPWIHYVLRVECLVRPGIVHVHVTRCRVLRTREVRPPALARVLTEAMRAPGATVDEVWLHPRAYVDVSGREAGEYGWRLSGLSETRPCAAFSKMPGWAHAPNGVEFSTASRSPILSPALPATSS